MKIDAKKTLSRVLIGFVLISIGFAIGKETTRRQLLQTVGATSQESGSNGEKVTVYYMHGTIRCVTCNQIEQAAHEVVSQDFSQALDAGRLTWNVINFEDQPELAKRYDVAASTVVVVHQQDGKDVSFIKLDETWQLTDHPEKLRQYIHDAINQALKGDAP